jgi:hypothetical protein
MRQISYGMQNAPMGSGGMGAMMGFMGLPFMSKGNGAGKGSGGPWMTVDPVSQSMWQGGYGNRPPGGDGGGGGPQIEDPTLPPYDPNDPNGDGSGKFSWQFPQYSQTWAFTPPEPTPYPYPQPFDPKKYGNPFLKDTKK